MEKTGYNYLDKNIGAMISRAYKVEPRHDGKEDSSNDDDGVESHLDSNSDDISLQFDGRKEVEEKGGDDGEARAWKKVEPEDLQHLIKRDVVVDVGSDI